MSSLGLLNIYYNIYNYSFKICVLRLNYAITIGEHLCKSRGFWRRYTVLTFRIVYIFATSPWKACEHFCCCYWLCAWWGYNQLGCILYASHLKPGGWQSMGGAPHNEPEDRLWDLGSLEDWCKHSRIMDRKVNSLGCPEHKMCLLSWN